MLEEALTSPTFPPAEASLALLSFLRYELPAGGTAAERRFIRLFPLLCDRVFGPLEKVEGGVGVGVVGEGGVVGVLRHEHGGWLSRHAKWSSSARSSSTGATTSSVTGTSSTGGVVARGAGLPAALSQEEKLVSDPVVQLLAAVLLSDSSSSSTASGREGGGGGGGQQPTLMDAISAETVHRPGVKFALSFNCIPKNSRVAILSLLDESGSYSSFQSMRDGVGGVVGVGNRENCNLLFGRVLRVKPVEQVELRMYLQTQLQLMQYQNRGGMMHYSQHLQASPMAISPLPHHHHHHHNGRIMSSSSLTSPILSPQHQHHHASFTTSSSSPRFSDSTSSSTSTTTTIPNIMLTMLEYYLFLFLRFPLATPPPPPPSTTPSRSNTTSARRPSSSASSSSQTSSSYSTTFSTMKRRRNDYSYGEAAYLHLFRGYLKHYLPHAPPLPPPPSSSSSSSSTTKTSSSSYRQRSHSDESEDTTTSSTLRTSSLPPPPPPLINFAPLDREAELFLRLVIEFWLEGSSSNGSFTPPTTAYAVQRASRATFSSSSAAATTTLNLDSSFQLATTCTTPSNNNGMMGFGGNNGNNYSVPMQVQRGIKLFINHVIGDPGVKQAVFAAQTTSTTSTTTSTTTTTTRAQNTRSTSFDSTTSSSVCTPTSPNTPTPTTTSPSSSSSGKRWCLTPTMTIIQPSFYNYIRMTLRHAPVHLSDSAFFGALRAWMVWIEPWNVVQRRKNIAANFTTSKAKDVLFNAASSVMNTNLDHHHHHHHHHSHHTSTSSSTRRKTTSTSSTSSPLGSNTTHTSYITLPKSTSNSKYTPEWEPYIAANLHLYTVPLAIFLKRAREFDFSDRAFKKSLEYVQMVLRIFSVDVVNVIDSLLVNTTHNNGNGGALLGPLVRRHERLLNEFRPPDYSSVGLAACQQDAHNLLEEIFLQHQKTVRELDFFDRIASKLEGLAGMGMRGEEIALERLVRQARIIVKFPMDYEVLPSNDVGGRGGGGSGGSRSAGDAAVGGIGGGFMDPLRPERVNGGRLTDRGRQQILVGSRKCSALDVAFIGDPMMARVKTYEISFLVDWSVMLSNWLNCTLGLVEDDRAAGRDVIGDGYLASVKRFLLDLDLKRFIWFRINLRFLADYRNLIFMSIVYMSWKALK